MRIYLDICCLKRPFDDQSQPRIHLETEATLVLIKDSSDMLFDYVHVRAHDLENAQNPLPQRAASVRRWLDSIPLTELEDEGLTKRTQELMVLGFKNFDSFHLASAELAGTEVFLTCDDRLLATARRNATSMTMRIVNPVDFAQEFYP